MMKSVHWVVQTVTKNSVTDPHKGNTLLSVFKKPTPEVTKSSDEQTTPEATKSSDEQTKPEATKSSDEQILKTFTMKKVYKLVHISL